MSPTIKKFLVDSKKVFSTKWSAANLHVPPWVLNAVIYITIIRSLAYGIELTIQGNAAVVSPLMAFVAIMGIQAWGILMLIGIAILIAGLIMRNTIIITIGALMCAAVWISFGLTLSIGFISLGTGGRHAVAALTTAATWAVFFVILLKTIKLNGVES